MEKRVYEDIIAKITAGAAVITGAGHAAPAHYAWWNGQYREGIEDESHPYGRPAIFIEFGATGYVRESGKARGAMPITLHIVQECYTDGRESDPQHADFKKLLEYPYLIIDLLDQVASDCGGSYELTEVEPDHDIRNLMIHRVRWRLKVRL